MRSRTGVPDACMCASCRAVKTERDKFAPYARYLLGWRGTFKGAIENFDPNFRNDKISTKSWEFVRDFGRGEIFGEISPSDDDHGVLGSLRNITWPRGLELKPQFTFTEP